MAYAFCLRFDAETEAAVVSVWHALAEGGVGDDMLRLGYPPHLSLAVLDDEPPLAVVEGAFEAVTDASAFRVQLGGVGRFPGTPILWLAADGGAVLGDLHRRLLGHLPVQQVREHYRAGAWVPHVTLQMEGDADRALAIGGALWPEARPARVIRLDLVQFPPVAVLRSMALA